MYLITIELQLQTGKMLVNTWEEVNQSLQKIFKYYDDVLLAYKIEKINA